MLTKFKLHQQVTACPAGKLPVQEVGAALGNQASECALKTDLKEKENKRRVLIQV